MANEVRIPGRDGTTTIISDSYGFGSITAGPESRPEDPKRWRPRVVTEDELVARFGGATPEELMALGLPKPVNVKTFTRFGTWALRTVREWRAEDADAFEQRIREMFARLPRK